MVIQLEVTRRVLARLPPLPEGTTVPGAELVDALSEWDLFPSGRDQAAVIELFERALEALRPVSRVHALQGELDRLLAEQQQAMFDPSSRPAIARLKELAARRQELGERLGPARQKLSVVERAVERSGDPSAADSLRPALEQVFGEDVPELAELPAIADELRAILGQGDREAAELDEAIGDLAG